MLVTPKKKGIFTKKAGNPHHTVTFWSGRGFPLMYLGILLPIFGTFVCWNVHFVETMSRLSAKYLNSSQHHFPFAEKHNFQTSLSYNRFVSVLAHIQFYSNISWEWSWDTATLFHKRLQCLEIERALLSPCAGDVDCVVSIPPRPQM